MQAAQAFDRHDALDTVRLLHALDALEKGDFSVRLPLEWTGVAGKVADTFNRVVVLNQRMVRELERVSRVVGNFFLGLNKTRFPFRMFSDLDEAVAHQPVEVGKRPAVQEIQREQRSQPGLFSTGIRLSHAAITSELVSELKH